MGSFNQHIACSTATGIVFGAGAHLLGFSMPTCLLSAGLCSIAGMLPDIDSDTSRSFQECIYFAAGLSAVLLVQRLREFSRIEEDIVLLTGACDFLFVRFVCGALVKKLTRHRGMFHSIPAAVFAGQLLFFLSTGTVAERLVKAAALTVGYLSHLILDEICSIDSAGRTLRLKKSFGTALKLYDSHHFAAGAVLYSLMLVLGFTAIKDPEIIQQWEEAKTQYAENQKQGQPQTFLEKLAVLQTDLKEQAGSRLGELKTAIQQEAAEFLTTRASSTPSSVPQLPVLAPVKQKYSDNFVFSRSETSGENAAQAAADSDDWLGNRLLPDSPAPFVLQVPPSSEPAPIRLQ